MLVSASLHDRTAPQGPRAGNAPLDARVCSSLEGRGADGQSGITEIALHCWFAVTFAFKSQPSDSPFQCSACGVPCCPGPPPRLFRWRSWGHAWDGRAAFVSSRPYGDRWPLSCPQGAVRRPLGLVLSVRRDRVPRRELVRAQARSSASAFLVTCRDPRRPTVELFVPCYPAHARLCYVDVAVTP